MWSVAEHGPTKELVEQLLPMLEKYNVTAYFCGHEHNMQHINSSHVQYYVTGAGHLIDDSVVHQVSEDVTYYTSMYASMFCASV